MVTTPRPIIDSVVQSVCGRAVERIVPLTGGGMNATYRVELSGDVAVIARIARQSVPWFTDEAHLMAQAHARMEEPRSTGPAPALRRRNRPIRRRLIGLGTTRQSPPRRR